MSQEPVAVNAPTVACEGDGPAIGHPKVYLAFKAGKELVCPYCGRTFRPAEGGRGH